MQVNRLILGDNIEILKALGSGSVDLVYLTPPFFSSRNCEVIWGEEGEARSNPEKKRQWIASTTSCFAMTNAAG